MAAGIARVPLTFGSALRQVRRGLGLSQEDLAERALLSVRTIGGIENGTQGRPRIGTVQALIAALAEDPSAEDVLTAAWRRDEPARYTIPLPPAPIVGRDAEMAVVEAALADPSTRVLTLTGAAGVGKTRLALEVAHRVAASFERASFVELADVGSVEDALRAIAAPFAPSLGADPIADVVRAIGGGRTLIVLDNAEHLVPDLAAAISRLCTFPGPTVVVTTRVALGVRAERVISIEPLRIEDAVSLLRARAEAAGAHVEDGAAALGAIVERLDRLPLAIELVAPRLTTLAPAALLERLRGRLPLLVDGAPDLPLRQRTLADAIAWSYELLAPRERAAFRALAVFAGGWTLDAAEAVLGADAVAVLERLVRANLVQRMRGPNDGSRYFVLQTVMEFARLELYAHPDERRAARLAHLAWAVAFVRTFGSRPKEPTVLLAIDAEVENLCAAIENGQAERAYDGVLELIVLNQAYWTTRGRAAQAVECLSRVLAAADRPDAPASPRWLALGYCVYANFVPYAGGNARDGLARLERALELARVAGDERTLSRTLAALLNAAIMTGDETRARTAGTEALAIAERLGDRFGAAAAQNNLGFLAELCGDLDEAERRVRIAAEAFRELDDGGCAAFALTSLAGIAALRGDVREARAILRETLRLARRRDDALLRGAVLRRTALAARCAGRPRSAALVAAIATRVAMRDHSSVGIARSLEEAAFALAGNAPELAVRVLGAVDRIMRETGLGRMDRQQLAVEALLDGARARLGPVAVDLVFASGRRESEDTIVAAIVARDRAPK